MSLPRFLLCAVTVDDLRRLQASYGTLSARGREADAAVERWADQIAEWEQFRQDAFQFAVDNGYDHPAFTDWVWHDAKDIAAAISATKATGGDNE